MPAMMQRAALLLLLAAPLQASRQASLARDDDEEATAPSSPGGDEGGDEATDEGGDEGGDDGDEEDQTAHSAPAPAPEPAAPEPESHLGDGVELVGDEEGTTIFMGDEDSAAVKEKREEAPETDVKNVMEIRTKLKFTSNKKTLANPELVEKILEDIKEQQEKMPGLKFIFCAHVGTTQIEKILTARPGFMEGRVESFKNALQPEGSMSGVSGTIQDEFMHFKAGRFAGLVMWAYGGETAPECAESDLKPPHP